MEKSCKMETYKVNKAMEDLEGWIMSMNIHLFHLYVLISFVGMFMKSYVTGKSLK